VNELALFAGAGGGILASHLLGWRTICAVEIDRYRRSVLCARQDDGALGSFPIWDDIKTFDGLPWRGRVDVVSGGFPCQAYSTAARGRNVADDLWPEFRRVVADVAPRYVFAENVSQSAIEAAADDLEEMGYQTSCIALSAADLGGDHIRPRYWIRAYADDEGELCGDIDAKVAIVSRLRSSVWQTEPCHPRVADGLASRVERYEATGNGQVAIVAAAAWLLSGGSFTVTDGQNV
jgi:DNA (cytosine-5)-methyltransferase 1